MKDEKLSRKEFIEYPIEQVQNYLKKFKGSRDSLESAKIDRRSFLKASGALTSVLALKYFTSLEQDQKFFSSVKAQSDADITVDPSNGDTLEDAVKNASNGDKILLQEGTDSDSIPFAIEKDIEIILEEGSTFTLDGSDHDPSNPSAWDANAISIRNTSGLTIDGTPGRFILEGPNSKGIQVVRSDNFTLRGITFRQCALSGLHLNDNADNGLIEWCSAYNNDGRSIDRPGDADGFAIVSGERENPDAWPSNNTFRYCISYYNSDDGYDTFRGHNTTFEKCIAYHNGYFPDGSESPAPGAGFKLAYDRENKYVPEGGAPPKRNSVIQCLSWGHGGAGILLGDERNNNGHLVERLTAWNNGIKGLQGQGNADIGDWDADSAVIRKSLLTNIDFNGDGPSTMTGNIIKPKSEWMLDTETDPEFWPTNPSSFTLPESGSDIANQSVGATNPGATWVQEVLNQTGNSTEGSSSTKSDFNLRLSGNSSTPNNYYMKTTGPIEIGSSDQSQNHSVFGNIAAGYLTSGSVEYALSGLIKELKFEEELDFIVDGEQKSLEELKEICFAGVTTSVSSGGSGYSGSAGSTNVGPPVVREAEADLTGNGATITRSSDWPTPNSDGYDITMEFDEVVNAVDDLGWQSGEKVDIEGNMEDGRLIIIPEGEYIIDENNIGDYDGPRGLMGDPDADPENVVLRWEKGMDESDGFFENGGETFLSSFTLDYREDEETSVKFIGGGSWNGNLIVEHIIQSGWEIPMNHFIGSGTDDPDTIQLFRDIDSRVPREKGDYKSETKNWVYHGRGMEGRVFHEGHQVNNATEAGFYTGKHPGEVHIRNIKTFNAGGTAAIRNAGEDSSIYGCHVVFDTDERNPNNRNIESNSSSEDSPFIHNRGIWLQSAEVSKNGCWVEKNTVEMRTVEHEENTSVAAVLVHGDTGGGIWKDNEIILDAENVANGFLITDPTNEHNGTPEIEIDGLKITGEGDPRNGALRIGRDGELKNLCIQTPNMDGIKAEDGAKVSVQDSTINVGGDTFDEDGGSIDRSNIDESGTCEDVDYVGGNS